MNRARGSAGRRRRYPFVLLYLLLVLASNLFRAGQGRLAHPDEGQHVVEVPAVDRGINQTDLVQIAYHDEGPKDPESPVILLVPGSPSHSFDLHRLSEALSVRYRVISPDLPGFGRSTRQIPDYSMDAHAHYLHALIDSLGLDHVHVVGYSLGGGSALLLEQQAPDRVASLSLVSSVGVQELELMGDYGLNHAIHGAQWVLIWAANTFLPHFGLLDDAMLNLSYARNFYQSDQRPLRSILTAYQGPLLIIHGREDALVPPAAATEHHRIVPQSELEFMAGGHLLVYKEPAQVAERLMAFADGVRETGGARRDQADPARVARAAQAFNAAEVERLSGIGLFVLATLIVVGTLVSEDLACIGAGLLVAKGIVNFAPAALAAFSGIFFGDLLLFLAGKYIGRPALRHRPFRWFFSEDAVQESSKWFSSRGPIVIILSRFVPGSRLPTYFTAGLLHTSLWKFLGYFFLAGAVWAPMLVKLSETLGGRLLEQLETYRLYTLVTVGVVALLLWLLVEVVIPLFSFRGRRLLLSAWRRKTRWEFWPMWAFYPPVFLYVMLLALRHRSLTVFTACNPAIPDGGFVGESKSSILRALRGEQAFVARFDLIPAEGTAETKLALVRQFMSAGGLSYPVVLKPDAGQRGQGVAVLRSDEAVLRYFSTPREPAMVQEHVVGYEFGFFYYRYPDQQRGHIFSITEKRFPVVIGDGKSTLERLILRDNRAVCMAHYYMARHRERLAWVPAEDEPVQLVEIGNHCRGAVFHDGLWTKTRDLENAIERIAHSFEGFYFGRFDVIAPNLEDLRQGRNFKIIELNGVTSEATHIYDPGNSLFYAYGILRKQWKIAFRIGDLNRSRGIRYASAWQLARRWLEFRPASEAEGGSAK